MYLCNLGKLIFVLFFNLSRIEKRTIILIKKNCTSMNKIWYGVQHKNVLDNRRG